MGLLVPLNGVFSFIYSAISGWIGIEISYLILRGLIMKINWTVGYQRHLQNAQWSTNTVQSWDLYTKNRWMWFGNHICRRIALGLMLSPLPYPVEASLIYPPWGWAIIYPAQIIIVCSDLGVIFIDIRFPILHSL